MGYGSYRASDWTKLKESKGISAASRSAEIFKTNSFQEKYNPYFITSRESLDSADSPASTPIIIGFDVTGSMGYLAEEIAKNALNKTILNIYDKNPITNPHVMCAAIGDICDTAPLQVTQFEADIRIVEQLMELWLEMHGGDAPEAYNLLWYFADKHTRTDNYKKRNQKGFLFTIGDAAVHPGLSPEDIKKVFNDKVDSFISNKDLIKSVSEKYNVFHIVTKDKTSVSHWEKILPGHVVFINESDIGYLSEVITSIILLTSGMTEKEVVQQWPANCRESIASIIQAIRLKNDEPVSKSSPSDHKWYKWFSRK